MRTLRFAGLAVIACALMPVDALPQALTNISSVRVQYNTRKNTVNPQGELKAQIDELDKQIAEAARLGRNAELRRLFAKGTTLLSGRPWTDALDYASSLVVRTDRVVADSAKPYAIRLEQIYAPSIELSSSLSAHVVLRKRPAAANGAAQQPGDVVKDLGTFDGVTRDLRDAPFHIDLDVRDVADGTYQVVVEVQEGARALGSASLLVSVRKGLDTLTARLEEAAARAPEGVRADILFPVDRMRHVNSASLELRTFDPDKDFAAAEAVTEAVKRGKNPFTSRTGDFKRHYLLSSAKEIIPYRLYVPTGYTASRTFPLIVALHGLGGTEDSFFDGYDRKLPELAEQHGYIVVAPLGYRVDGSYGWGVGAPPADLVARTLQERSEDDVLQTLQIVRQQYRIDDSRIYLMGHSMGGIGTWKLAAKHPDIWAAIAPFAGTGQPASLERIKVLPELIVHGDNDLTVSVQGSRGMVAKLKELGTEFKYIEVPGGTHGNIVAPNLGAMVEFFNAHRKTAQRSQQ